jgi:hypothetical protein
MRSPHEIHHIIVVSRISSSLFLPNVFVCGL